MTKRWVPGWLLAILILPFLRAVPALAIGDTVVPHVVDGVQNATVRYRTKFDISNISYHVNTLSKVTILFFTANGDPWSIPLKNYGTTSALTLNLGSLQTMRIETLGTGSLTTGYAIVRNLETTNWLPDDYETSITVYYEVLSGNDVTDTVSVPVGKPTVSWSFPIELDKNTSPWLLTGFAIVNLSNSTNDINIDLYQAMDPLSGTAPLYSQSVSFPLAAGEKRAGFPGVDFLPSLSRFKGLGIATATGPVAFLALLQTPTPIGPQYATMAATNLDSLRRNNILYLPQGFSLDADLMICDYFVDESWTGDSQDSYYAEYYKIPWDVLFLTIDPPSGTQRELAPQSGAQLAPIGIRDVDQFDAISIETLRGLTYANDSIILDDGNNNLQSGYTFAIKTGLGRYVKARIREVITYSASNYVDLALEIYIYK